MSEIIEGNKLIAEFMNVQLYYKGVLGDTRLTYKINDAVIAFEDEFKYHTSWDWLMPVVEKIEGLNVRVSIENGQYQYCKMKMGKKEVVSEYAIKKIEVVWLAVVEFIKTIKN